MPIIKIAEKLGVGDYLIRDRLKSYQIPKRPRIKNGGYLPDFLRGLQINEQKILQYQGNNSLHGVASGIGIKIKTKRINPNQYAVTRIA